MLSAFFRPGAGIAAAPAQAEHMLAVRETKARGAADGGDASVKFDELYDQHVDFIWRSARRLGASEAFADDVVQQVFLVAYRKLSEFEGRSSAKTWLFAILMRVLADHRRSLRRKTPHWFQRGEPLEPDALASSLPDPSEAVERADAMRAVELLLAALDEDKRAVFILADLEQMTAAEISEATGMPIGSVYSRLRAARTDVERAVVRLRKQGKLPMRSTP